nr:OPT/YSL family transporter [Candidatus Poseidoniaceae archaeon]
GDFNLPMVLIGVAIACIIIWKKMPVMSVAIGIYLPLFLSVPIIIGGLIHFFASRITHFRIDGTLEGEASSSAENAAKEVTDKGVLIGAGFIAGESLMGVLIAFFIVTFEHPKDWFDSINQLSQTLSVVFYGCFVAVFIFLATRAIPRIEGHSLVSDCYSVITDAGRRFIESVRPR